MQLRKITTSLLLFFTSLLLWSCEKPEQKATVNDLSKPLSNSPTPTPTPPPTVDPRRTDLNRVVVGTAAPDFSLEDMNGKMVHLSDFRGKKYVVLVFYRGYFWTHCQHQLGQLKSLLSDEEKKNIVILAISKDSHDDSRKMIYETNKPEYPGPFDIVLLSDTPHRVIDAYGVYNPAEEQFDAKTNSFPPSGIPYPITYIINKEGIVVSRLFDQVNYERPTNAQVRSELIRVGAVK